jgi:BirA family biotin operon repressor/biotin-[acetyl-CoA-carboxylase] ligase
MVSTVMDHLPSDLAHALVAAEPRLAGFAHLRYVAEVDSTNDVALALAEAGAPEGTAVLADFQRAGRGRRGQSWFSPPGAGLYLSVVVRPGDVSGALSLLTLAAGVAAAESISAMTSLPIELKWPNDLVIGRPWRKLGGILCEASGTGARVDAVIIGIGLNVRHAAFPPELADRATSLESELGRPIGRSELVVEILVHVREAIDRLRAGEREWVSRDWRRFGRAGFGGAAVRWTDERGSHQGLARDIDADGALLVEVNGLIERLVAGDVTWERLARA